MNGQAAVQCLTKPLGINTSQDFEADTVYYETVYYTSIMTKMELLTFSFGHTSMDLYQSLYFELFPCIIYIYIIANASLTSYFESLCSLCVKSNSAACNTIFISLYCVITLKVILILKLKSCLLYMSDKSVG